jgi:hypothetical protein
MTIMKVEGHALERADGIDFSNRDSWRNVEDGRRVIENRAHSASHEFLGYFLRCFGRYGDDSDTDALLADDSIDLRLR